MGTAGALSRVPRSGLPYTLPEGLSVPSLAASRRVRDGADLQPRPGLVGAAVLALEPAVDRAAPGLLPEVGGQQQLGRAPAPAAGRVSPRSLRSPFPWGGSWRAPCRPGSSSLRRTARQKKKRA